jgi:hypothetical protein
MAGFGLAQCPAGPVASKKTLNNRTFLPEKGKFWQCIVFPWGRNSL